MSGDGYWNDDDGGDWSEDEDDTPDPSQEFTASEARTRGSTFNEFHSHTQSLMRIIRRQADVAGFQLLWDTLEVQTEIEQHDTRTLSGSSEPIRTRIITMTVRGIPRP